MSNGIDKLNNLADIDFVDTDVETLLAALIGDYEKEYAVETGQSKTLAQGDPIRILLYAEAARIYAMMQSVNNAAKQNLLKYASGNYLDQLAARVEVTREEARAATAQVRFELSAAQKSAVSIPSGTRVAAGGVYFATTEYKEIPVGTTFVDIPVTCTQTGIIGNGYAEGQINILVDPLEYIAGVANTDTSAGGADREDDDSLRERVYLRPESFSVAGPSGAYEYFVKEYDSSIADVVITSLAPGTVNIYFILEDGTTPESTRTNLQEYLSDENIRPLTDTVMVSAPERVNYNIDLSYYINESDSDIAGTIRSAVETAIEDYITWQRAKIGRDINPGYLQHLIYKAGAKRVVINSPAFTKLSKIEIAELATKNVSYGGTEED